MRKGARPAFRSRRRFFEGLVSDRAETVVRARGEDTLLSACPEIAIEQESDILSARDKGTTA
jgi:hypothetical protein